MLKNLVRFKQWTGERLGAPKPTLQSEDLQELEEQMDEWHNGFEQMYQTIKLSHAQLAKTKNLVQESRSKYTPLQAIGDAWACHGKEVADSSPKLGSALVSLGEAEMDISTYFDQLTLQLGTDYMQLLRDSRTCYSKIVELRKKLETKRLDYAAHLSRLQKAKKEKPQLEQLLQQSKIKYEDTQRELLTKMIDLEQYKEAHRTALYNFMDLQIGCFLKAAKVLQGVKERWPQGTEYDDDDNDGTCSSINNEEELTNNAPRQSTDSAFEQSTVVSDQRRPSAAPSQADQQRLHPLDTNRESFCSSSTGGSNPSLLHRSKSDFGSARSVKSETPSRRSSCGSDPNRKQSTIGNVSKLRKAMYDFAGDHKEDLRFKAGDIITVLEEINEGWWLGEVCDVHGHKHCGIFPLNYTEALDAPDIPPPLPEKDANLIEEASLRQHARTQSETTEDNTAAIPNASTTRSSQI
ncbi:hypothetical protein BJV82DRAFT_280222 [Fennellomyces sp. T-0311]|nr:hypothetical protein BJV82DRAFT_280222 [Fennellomyces sp. T-0311]